MMDIMKTETLVDFMESEFELNCMQMDFLEDLADMFETVDEACKYGEDILQYGCVSGTVSHLVYTHDVMKFLADNHFDVEMYINQIGEQTDAKIYLEDLNFVELVWNAYETMVADTMVLVEMALDAIE